MGASTRGRWRRDGAAAIRAIRDRRRERIRARSSPDDGVPPDLHLDLPPGGGVAADADVLETLAGRREMVAKRIEALSAMLDRERKAMAELDRVMSMYDPDHRPWVDAVGQSGT